MDLPACVWIFRNNWLLSFQISPFPFDLVKEEIEKYPQADVVFAQEEHKNMGPWHYVKDRFATVFNKMGSQKQVK